MKFREVQLPSNRRFGFLFALIFSAIGAYYIYPDASKLGLTFLVLGVFVGAIAIFRENLLLPFNKIWMRFGFTLGLVVSPIILGIVFFALLTPVALISRVLGRDELRLKQDQSSTYWKQRSMKFSLKESFKYQF